MVGGDLTLVFLHDAAALLRTGHHTVDRLVQGAVIDEVGVGAGGQQCGLVQDVSQVRAGVAGRLFGHGLQVDAGGHRLALRVDLQDLVAADQVGGLDGDLPVEAAWAQQRRVKHVGAVGGGNQDDVGFDVEAVHFHQQLVQGLLAFVVAAANAGAAVTTERRRSHPRR